MTSASLSDFASFMVRSIIETKACITYVQWDKSKNHVSEEALYVFETFQKLCYDSTGENMVNFFKKIMDPMRKQKASNNGQGHIIHIRTESS